MRRDTCERVERWRSDAWRLGKLAEPREETKSREIAQATGQNFRAKMTVFCTNRFSN